MPNSGKDYVANSARLKQTPRVRILRLHRERCEDMSASGSKVEKVVVVGLDAPIPGVLKKYAEEGLLPNFKALIDRGVWGKNCLAPFPTITPPNWTAIVTGSTLGTHGITCFNLHIPGDPLNKTHQAFTTKDCKVEYIWDVAEKEGIKSIIFNYPSTWPPTIKEGVQVAGMGLSVNESRIEPGYDYCCRLFDFQLFTTRTDLPLATVVELKSSGSSFEAELHLQFRRALDEFKPITWKFKADGGKALLLTGDREIPLKLGEWTENIFGEFETTSGDRKKAVYKLKLLELGDGKLDLFMTPACAMEGWAYPEKIAEELPYDDGLPLPGAGFAPYRMGWIDEETCVEVEDIQHRWYASAVTYLMKNRDWGMLFMHAHCPDWMYHAIMNQVDPLVADPETVARAEIIEKACYQSLDRMLGAILQTAGENALVIVVSDHGAVPTLSRNFAMSKILREAGLTVYKTDEEGNEVIDWSKTRAVPQRSCYVYVNLKGRDPDGIVEPEEYEKVVDEIIKVFLDYTDPDLGAKPVAFALKREEARMIGLYGDRIGDVLIGLRPEWGGEHGQIIPPAKLGRGEMNSLFIMAGPGVKKGYEMERTMNLIDIVPTICHLVDLPVPRDCEGAVLYQALEDPDAKRKERRDLELKYKRLLDSMDDQRRLTHTYNE